MPGSPLMGSDMLHLVLTTVTTTTTTSTTPTHTPAVASFFPHTGPIQPWASSFTLPQVNLRHFKKKKKKSHTRLTVILYLFQPLIKYHYDPVIAL